MRNLVIYFYLVILFYKNVRFRGLMAKAKKDEGKKHLMVDN